MDEEVKEEKTKTPTTYIIVGIIIIGAVLVGGYFMNKGSESKNTSEETAESPLPRVSGPATMKGQKFSDSKLFNQAVQIYPGAISESAKATMSGWTLKTKTLADGTIQADLVPVGSEATEGDTAHTFVLKTGDKLYFADINPNDDGPTEDSNTHDDMGIVVDANGIIQ